MRTREIVLLVVLILVIVALVKIAEFFKSNNVQEDATRFVLEDLHSKYQDADIGIITVKEATNDAGQKYYDIKAKVTKQPDSACPERMHIFYNYPTQNFVPREPEVITTGCKVCTEASCVLVFPEEAVIASHTFTKTEAVNKYVADYADAVPDVTENQNGWTIVWSSPTATFYYVVEISKNNTVSLVKRINK